MIVINPTASETHKQGKALWFSMTRHVRKDLTAALVIGNDAVIGVGRYKGTECKTWFDGQQGRKLFIRLEAKVIQDRGK